MTATQVSKDQCIQLQSNPGYYLIKDAAYAWDRAIAAFGKQVLITGAWRSYETQERIFRERYQTTYIQYEPGKVDARPWLGRLWYRKPGEAAAAIPGTSNHGGGLAVDVKTRREAGDPPYTEAVIFGSWADADRTRFLRVAAEHGWDDDEGRIVNELWHLTYYPARDQHRGVKPTNILQEDDMSAIEQQVDDLHRLLLRKEADGRQPPGDVVELVRRILIVARRTEADVNTLVAANRVQTTAIATLAKSVGIDPAVVIQTLNTAVRETLQAPDFQIVLTPKEN